MAGQSRPWHKLRPTRSKTSPVRLITFHVEPLVREVADGEYEHVFGTGHAVASYLSGGEQVEQAEAKLSRPEDLYQFIARHAARDRSTWIYAHGLVYQLTLVGYWDYVTRGDEKFLWGVLEDPPSIVCGVKGRCLRKWVDTANYWRIPQWQMTDLCGSAVDAAPSGTTRPASVGTVAQTVSRGLARLLTDTIRSLAHSRACTWQYTASSLAWACYRNSFLDAPIYLHGHSDALMLERQSLFGGRLQVLRSGWIESVTYALDVNSLYPYVMATRPMPCKLVSWQETATLGELREAIRGYHCIAQVHAMAPPYPLPLRRSGQVVYTTEDDWYTLSGAELSAVVRDGAVTAVGQLARYETADLFSRYVADLYPQKILAKREGRIADYELTKMMLNGLSGKFAQLSRRWDVDPGIPCPDRWAYFWAARPGDLCPRRCRALDGVAQVEVDAQEKRDSFPAVTAAITSGGRQVLAGVVHDAGPDEVYYLDTDSVHVSGRGRARLDALGWIESMRLGALKEVVTGADAYYWGPKQYRVGDHWVSNVLRLVDHPDEAGYIRSQTRRGLEFTFAAPRLDAVYLRDITIRSQQALSWPVTGRAGP